MNQERECPECKGTCVPSDCCKWECLDCGKFFTNRAWKPEEITTIAMHRSIRNQIGADKPGSVQGNKADDNKTAEGSV